MQAPTHILAGVIINRIFNWNRYKAIGFLCMFLVAILFHAIFDKLALVTFCPATADFNNPIWVAYHLVLFLTAILFLYIWGGQYKWGILFTFIPDIDWPLVHIPALFGKEIIGYNVPHIHVAMDYVMNHIYPFCFINLLPNNRTNPLALVWELLVIGLLLLLIRVMNNYRRNIHF